jgi:hypothetical protein
MIDQSESEAICPVRRADFLFVIAGRLSGQMIFD